MRVAPVENCRNWGGFVEHCGVHLTFHSSVTADGNRENTLSISAGVCRPDVHSLSPPISATHAGSEAGCRGLGNT